MPRIPQRRVSDELAKATRIRFGVNVRNERRKRGVSQKEVQAKTGIHASHLSEIERGVTNMSLEIISRLAFYFKCAERDLL